MKNNFPRIHVPPDIKRKMVEIARKKLDGIKFRRQQPIGYFVVDFYASPFRLVVEVDGPIHDHQVNTDKARQDILEELGLSVLRIKTETVESSLPTALALIRNKIQEIKQSTKFPSPLVRDGQGGG